MDIARSSILEIWVNGAEEATYNGFISRGPVSQEHRQFDPEPSMIVNSIAHLDFGIFSVELLVRKCSKGQRTACSQCPSSGYGKLDWVFLHGVSHR